MEQNTMFVDGPWLKDTNGRTLMLRGVNLSGSSKTPAHPPIINEAHYYNHRDVCFVGRPFPREEANEHFERLRRWGLTFLRFIVTWEAIEHSGPGIYDTDYLDYLEQVIRIAAAHGFHILIDIHQDAWSRMSGGDGAPGWTFETVGLDVTRFRDTGAANIYPFDDEPFVVHWQTNYSRLAAATMFTLFFGGDDFAPKLRVDGEPVQSFLQRHYFNAVKQIARRLHNIPNVVGYDTMNEPSNGFIGIKSHTQQDQLHLRKLGISPTPYQAMLLGSGYSQEVEVWGIRLRGLQEVRRIRMNPHGARAWLPGKDCIWREHGVWDVDDQGTPRLLKPHYFTHVVHNGTPTRVDFGRDYLRPFINRFAHEVRQIDPPSILFVEQVPRLDMPAWGSDDAPNIVNASHWYDIQTLFLRFFIPFLNMNVKTGRVVFGSKRIQRLFSEQMAAIKQESQQYMGNVPTLIGEFGISYNMPFNLNYRLGWFGNQEAALDTHFRALEANLLNATIWNYTSDNTNTRGDGWNTEDLSIFSRDQQHTPNDPESGGRALRAVVRPYACRTAGEPLYMRFNMQQREFTYIFRHDPHIQAPTELFIPALHYPDGYTVQVSDGTFEYDDENQTLRYWYDADHDDTHVIHIRCPDRKHRHTHVATHTEQTIPHLSENAPALWEYAYKMTDITDTGDTTVVNDIRILLDRMAVTELDALVNTYAPDIIVCTHFQPIPILSLYKHERNLHAPIYCVVTDYTGNAKWVHPDVQQYFVATPIVKQMLIERGVDEATISIVGIPIDPLIAEPKEPQQIREEHQLHRPPIITLIGSALNVERVRQIVMGMLASTLEGTLIVVAGRNSELEAALSDLSSSANLTLQVLGYVNYLDDLVTASDLVITKSGGLIVSEILARHTPMIVFDPIPGQEHWNADYVVSVGAGVQVRLTEMMPAVVRSLLADTERLHMMRTRAQQAARPHAALEIATAIIEDAGAQL